MVLLNTAEGGTAMSKSAQKQQSGKTTTKAHATVKALSSLVRYYEEKESEVTQDIWEAEQAALQDLEADGVLHTVGLY